MLGRTLPVPILLCCLLSAAPEPGVAEVMEAGSMGVSVYVMPNCLDERCVTPEVPHTRTVQAPPSPDTGPRVIEEAARPYLVLAY